MKMSLKGNVQGMQVTVTDGKGKGDKNTQIVASASTVVDMRRNEIALLAVCSGSSQRGVSSGRVVELRRRVLEGWRLPAFVF